MVHRPPYQSAPGCFPSNPLLGCLDMGTLLSSVEEMDDIDSLAPCFVTQARFVILAKCSPHALHSVRAPSGPLRHSGVEEILQLWHLPGATARFYISI